MIARHGWQKGGLEWGVRGFVAFRPAKNVVVAGLLEESHVDFNARGDLSDVKLAVRLRIGPRATGLMQPLVHESTAARPPH
jgi:hypothetical protein